MSMRLIIVTDESEIEATFQAIQISREEFEIIGIYDIEGEKRGGAIEREGFNKIGDIAGMQYDYILNVNVLEDKVYDILVKLTSADKILNYGAFTQRFLSEGERMECLKDRIRLKYPIPEEAARTVCMGDFTYGSPFVATSGHSAKAKIGKFCSFAKNVMLLLEEDHRTDWNSTYPFNSMMPEFSYIEGHPSSKGDIVIGNDVWIATGARILSGVTIGDGCVIGAHAVVAKSVPAYSVVAGNPGRVVKKRFDDATIEKLTEMQWWDWEYEDIYRVIPLLQSAQIDSLYEYYLKNVKNDTKAD